MLIKSYWTRFSAVWVLVYYLSAVQSELSSSTGKGYSYSLLRKPRLELNHVKKDAGAVLYFYNADVVQLPDDEIDDMLNCTVTVGQQEETQMPVTLTRLPGEVKWPARNIFGLNQTLQTRTTYNISYNVEGNLACRAALSEALIISSNTILLRFMNAQSLVVRFGVNPSSQNSTEIYNIMRDIHRQYANKTYSEQVGRLLNLRLDPEPQVTVRVSCYSQTGVFDQKMIYRNVREVSQYIADLNKLAVIYVRSTHYCPEREEGNFTWPMTSVGLCAYPDSPDVGDAPLPKRCCVGNFFEGVYWDKVMISPAKIATTGKNNIRIRDLIEKLNVKDPLKSLKERLSNKEELTPLEIYDAAVVLREASENFNNHSISASSPDVKTVAEILNTILHYGKSNVMRANSAYGSSSIILDSVQALITAAVSPVPTPTTGIYFSAFASQSISGTKGFTYSSGKRHSMEREMSTINYNSSLLSMLKKQPNVTAMVYNMDSDYGIMSAVYDDDSLFQDANPQQLEIVGPVFSLKIFHSSRNIQKKAKPFLLTLRLDGDGEIGIGRRKCVAWEKTRMQGWSTYDCPGVKSMTPTITLCMCVIWPNSEMYFSLGNFKNSDVENGRIKLIPMKSYKSALLVIQNKLVSNENDSNLKCQLDRTKLRTNQSSVLEVDDKEMGIPYEEILDTKYLNGKVNIYMVNQTQEGYLTCSINGEVSNEIPQVQPNSALIFLSRPQINSTEVLNCTKVHDYFKSHSLEITYIEQTVTKVIIRVTQTPKMNHESFIRSLKNLCKKFPRDDGLTCNDVKSTQTCLKNEDFIRSKRSLPERTSEVGSDALPITAKCTGDYIHGRHWIGGQRSLHRNIWNPPGQPSHTSEIFREILDLKNENETLSIAETSILKTAIKDLAEKPFDPNTAGTELNISSVVNIVNIIIEAETDANEKTEDNYLIVPFKTILEPIDTLLQRASTPTPVPIEAIHFSAVAVSPGPDFKGFMTEDQHIQPISSNQTIKDILRSPPKMGAYIHTTSEIGLIYTNFKNGSLFRGVDGTQNRQVDSPVVGFKAFNNERKDTTPGLMVLIIFSNDDSKDPRWRECHYWDIEESRWATDGCVKVNSEEDQLSVSDNIDICLCTHLTHFAMLISDMKDFHPKDNAFLENITTVGCSISFTFLLGIFLLSIIFPSWRKGANRKIQLNLSGSVALLMASYLIIAFCNERHIDDLMCVTLGAFVHYSVLASFFWMLVVALLQLVRLTRKLAIGGRQHLGRHLVLKASLLGWGIPILPVAATLIAGTSLYIRHPKSALCYPSGTAFYASVLAPVGLVVFANFSIFVWLIKSIFTAPDVRANYKDVRKLTIQRLYSAVFLFCLLGITWIIGLLIEFSAASQTTVRVLSYIFCLTATLQGTSLFFFFVLCEEGVKKAVFNGLSKLFCNCPRYIQFKYKTVPDPKIGEDTIVLQITLHPGTTDHLNKESCKSAIPLLEEEKLCKTDSRRSE